MVPGQGVVRERLARWQRTGDPRDLWPGLEEREFRQAMDEVGRITRAVLAQGDSGGGIDCRFSTSPRALGVAAFASGLGPLLGYWVESGTIRVGAPAAAVLADHLAQGRARARRLDAALGTVLDAMAARGVAVFVLKGLHTAWTYFPEPGTRPSSDIDLLVSPADLGEASAVLTALGYRAGASPTDGSRRDWLPPDSPPEPLSLEITHRDNPWSLDLHVSLDRTLRFGLRSRFGTPTPAEAVIQGRAGRSFYVLPPPVLLAWLAFHAASHLSVGPMLRYVELVLVIRRDFDKHCAAWEAFLDVALRAGAAGLLYPALELAERLAPGSVPDDIRRRLRRSTPWAVRGVVSRLQPETSQQLYRRSLDVHLMWLTSVRGVVTFVGGAFRPPDGGWRSYPRILARRLYLLLKGGVGLLAGGRRA